MFQENICLNISAVGLFCCDKFEETPNKKVSNLSNFIQNSFLAWLEVMRRETLSSGKVSFRGLVLTGWSRYDHFAVLCELLPVAMPSLILNLVIIAQGKL